MSKPTYPIYTNICGWNAMLAPHAPRPSLTRSATVDYAIVGAGFTGLAVARRLHEIDPQARIVVVDASTIGEGSSARNSGFVSRFVLPRSATMEDAQNARRQTDLIAEAFDWLTSIMREHAFDCDIQQAGALHAAATEAGEASLRKVVEVAQVNALSHEVLDRAKITTRIGSKYYRFGLYLPDTYLLQPAALIRGLADALPEPITLHENTVVTRVKKSGGQWHLDTKGGTISAKTAILANNSFIRKLGYLNSRMATIFTYAAVTQALSSDERHHLGTSPLWGLLPSHRLGTTLRRIGSDRLMVRSLYAHESELNPDHARKSLRDRFHRRWPALAHVDFEYLWAGTTAFTMNGAPWWGQLDDGLYASGGCNGAGIAKGTMLGRRLAELIKGVGDPKIVPEVMGTASWIAPEPFRSIGFKVISNIESRKAGLES